jgi:redox-sensing transcriptional repressor
MGTPRRLPDATVTRLPVYLRVLSEAADQRAGVISSELLAARAGVNAAQVRKDLSHLGSYGTRGVGYNVGYLIRQINRQLGLTEDRRAVIVGVGNLGHALAGYPGFAQRGFRIVAALDDDPAKSGEVLGDLVVRPFSELDRVVHDERATIGIVTTPAQVAQAVADALVGAGIGSVLNFSPTRVRVPPHVVVRHVDLSIELQILSYYEQQATQGDLPERRGA